MNVRLERLVEEVRGTWRYRQQALIIAWVVAVIGWSVAVFWRDVYRANARVFVDTGTALKPVLQGLAVTQDVDAQLNYARQSLLGTPVLSKIAIDTGLLTANTDPSKRAKILEDMAGRVTVSVRSGSDLGNEGRETSGIVYGISYRDRARARALAVVQALVNTLINDTLGGKREGSEQAQKFLQAQITEYEQRLSEAEQRLADFKKINVGVMPNDQGGYFARLQNELDAVRTSESALLVAKSRRDEVQRQLHGESAIAAATAVEPAAGAATAGGGDTMSRIRETQSKLDELLLKYTDQHPDVVAARETLQELKHRREAALDAMRRGDVNAVADSGAGANPIYQSMMLGLNQANLEVTTLQRQLDDHRRRVAELRSALNTVPQVEAEYEQLTRDYDVNKTQFTALLVQLQKSKLGQDAETNGSLRFEVIEPPNADFRAKPPSRTQLLGLALLIGIGAGGGAAFLRHKLNPVFWSPGALVAAAKIELLGTVCSGFPEKSRRIHRHSIIFCSISAAALVLLALALILGSQRGLIDLPIGRG